MRTFFVYIVLICFYFNLLIFALAHSHMSFHKCWNLALVLFAYDDILVYGQYNYLFSVYQYWLDLKRSRGEICIWLYDIDSGIQRICNSLNYNIICPCSLPCHIFHVVLLRVFIVRCFLYTTQGDAEDVELQQSVYIKIILRGVN